MEVTLGAATLAGLGHQSLPPASLPPSPADEVAVFGLRCSVVVLWASNSAAGATLAQTMAGAALPHQYSHHGGGGAGWLFAAGESRRAWHEGIEGRGCRWPGLGRFSPLLPLPKRGPG